jgi:hypothetical protein
VPPPPPTGTLLVPNAGRLLSVACGRADPQHDIVCRPYTAKPEGKGGERDSRLSCTARAPLRRRRHAQFKFCVRHAHAQVPRAPPNFKLILQTTQRLSLHPTWNGNSISTNIFYYESLRASRSMNDASSHPVYERVYSRKVSVSTRRTRVAFWSIFNFIPSRKSDRRWGFLR